MQRNMDTNIVFSISARPTSLNLNFSLNARLTHQQSGLKSMLSQPNLRSFFAWFDDIVKALCPLTRRTCYKSVESLFFDHILISDIRSISYSYFDPFTGCCFGHAIFNITIPSKKNWMQLGLYETIVLPNCFWSRVWKFSFKF